MISFGDAQKKVPSLEDGRSAIKSEKKLSDQTRPFSQLNTREILQELLTWEHIVSDDMTPQQSLNENHLLSKFDKYMLEKEDQNQNIYDQIQKLKSAPFKNKKQAQAALDAMPAPDPSIPPLAKVTNEPFGDSSSFKFNDDVVLEKLNDFADSTYKIGESLFKRIVLGDFFNRSSSAQMNPFASKNDEESKREAPESLVDDDKN